LRAAAGDEDRHQRGGAHADHAEARGAPVAGFASRLR
jgi:hypothetical protein